MGSYIDYQLTDETTKSNWMKGRFLRYELDKWCPDEL